VLSLENVSHSYPGVPVLDGISIRLDDGRIGCLLGPSGCGKTTVLRCIAGFERVSRGEIRIGETLLSSASHHVAPARRRIGMVFQDYALLPHLSVANNVAFGLSSSTRRERLDRVEEMLAMVGLEEAGERLPHELSGGQQQRVAIARALAPRPRLLLMDEPFSNLDAGLRNRLGAEVRDLLKAFGTTVLLVTHDHHDALALADDVGVLVEGRLQQWASAYDIYHRPVNRFVADFVGRGAWLPGRVIGPRCIEIEVGIAEGDLTGNFSEGMEVDLLLRPDDVVHDDDSKIIAEVVARHFRGPEFIYELKLASGARLVSAVPSHHDHPVGSRIGIRLETDHIVAFERVGAVKLAGQL